MVFESGVIATMFVPIPTRKGGSTVSDREDVVFDEMEVRDLTDLHDKGVDRPPEYGSYGRKLGIREGDVYVLRFPNTGSSFGRIRHFVAVARARQSLSLMPLPAWRFDPGGVDGGFR